MAGFDYRLEDFKLNVVGSRSLDTFVGDSVTSATLELAIDGASVVTILLEDPDYHLLNSDVLSRWAWGDAGGGERNWIRAGRPVDARLDDKWFRLVKITKTGRSLTLVFEDRDVTYLRRHKGFRKAARRKVTRAEFVKLLVDEVKAGGGIKLHAPELHKKQPIAKKSQRVKDAEREKDGKAGIGDGEDLTVQGKAATREQIKNGQRVVDVCDSLDAPDLAALATMEAVIVESWVKNLPGGDLDSRGILQVRDSTAAGIRLEVTSGGQAHGAPATQTSGRFDNRDIEQCVTAFLTRGFFGKGGAIALARAHPEWTAGKVAQAVQGSAFPGRYDLWKDEAQKWLDAHGNGGVGRPGKREDYEFKREDGETSWDAIGRLANEVNWRRFMRDGRLWFMSEEDLFAQRHSLVVEEGENGVDNIDFDLDVFDRRGLTECTVAARADRWTVLPGMVVLVKGVVPVAGKWLVSKITRSLVDESGALEVTLAKPLREVGEPRNENARVSKGDQADSDVEKVRKAATRISDAGGPYVYGGGHGPKLSSLDPKQGLDCSSSTALALKKGGMFDGSVAIVSGEFARTWGEPGRGKRMTVWANDEHVWTEFYDEAGNFLCRFDTSPYGVGGSGPRIRKKPRPTNGFVARRWPGT